MRKKKKSEIFWMAINRYGHPQITSPHRERVETAVISNLEEEFEGSGVGYPWSLYKLTGRRVVARKRTKPKRVKSK